jgi:hypothetical protein
VTHNGAILRAAIGSLAALLTLAALLAFASSAWAAPDPSNKISFKFEGCDLAPGETLPNADGDFVCADTSYNEGNLGKGWNELDLVPHRLTVGNSGSSSETFSVVITADAFDAGHPGYDVISVPVINDALSDPGCVVTAGPQTTLSPGVGGIDESIYRLLTITAPADGTCVLDYYERLALGSHLFPGSSLHSNLLNQSFGTAGIGAKDRSIPVKEISPQELDKTMTASQDQDVHWAISKEASPVNVDLNDCLEGQDQAAVSITINYTKLPPQPDGTIQVITTITATNPANRPITVNVTDVIRSGTTVLDTEVFAPLVVPANSSDDLVHTTTVPNGTTDLNDVATATYTDQATGIPVPGQTEATAEATVQPSNVITNDSATISDVESITGAGLSYRVDSTTDNTGSFTTGAFSPGGLPYPVPGPFTTADVFWLSGTKTASGSVTFGKTIKFDGSASSSGTLSDVATVTGSDGFTATANASVGITATKCAKLTIKKVTDPASDPQDFHFDLTGGGVTDVDLDTDTGDGTLDSEASFTLSPGQLGAHTVTEAAVGGWTLTDLDCTGDDDSSTSLANREATLDIDSGEDVVCTFTNTKHASLTVVKVTDPASDPQDFDFDLTGLGVPADLDLDTDGGDATLPSQDSFSLDASELGAHTVTESPVAGWSLTNLVCTGAGGDSSTNLGDRKATLDIDAGEDVVCTFTNTKGASLTVVKVTDPASDPQDFDFDLTGSGVPAGLVLDTDASSAGTPSQETFALSAAQLGAYTVTETALPDWDLTNLVCTGAGGDSSTNLGDRKATLDIDAGETVVCTFTNTKRGEAIVLKTEGDDTPAGEWTFTLDGVEKTTDANGRIVWPNLEPGTYTLCEVDIPEGWHSSLENEEGAEVLENGDICIEITVGVGQRVTISVDNTKPDIELEKFVRLLPDGSFAKTAFAHVGDTVEYRFEVTNPGVGELTVAFADPRCDAGTLSGPTGDDGDGKLDEDETWVYLCRHLITAQDPDPLPNTATVTGTDRHGNSDSDESSAAVDIIHPAIDIEKTGPATANVGDALSYTLTVTNPGDTPFAAQDVVVTDPKCQAPPAGPNTGSDATPGSLDPGDTWTYTCTAQTAGQPAGTFVNTANVSGKDFLGKTVTDTDDFPTVLEAQAVLPAVPGSARLRGPSGCVKGPFTATVRGSRIARVTFFVDGKRFKRLTAPTGEGSRFTVRINPRGRGFGVHRVTARVEFAAASETRARTLRLSFQRCRRQVVKPRFTG